MTLRTKILVGYGIALLLMAATLAWAFAGLLALGSASEAILRENYRSILAAQNMVGAIERQDSAALLLMLGYGEEGAGAVQRERERSSCSGWRGPRTTSRSRARRRSSRASRRATRPTWCDFGSCARRRARAPGGRSSTTRPCCRTSRRCARAASSCATSTRRRCSRPASGRARWRRRALWSTGAIGGGGAGGGAGLQPAASRRLVRPLRQMMAATERIARGRVRRAGGGADLGRAGPAGGGFQRDGAQAGGLPAS